VSDWISFPVGWLIGKTVHFGHPIGLMRAYLSKPVISRDVEVTGTSKI